MAGTLVKKSFEVAIKGGLIAIALYFVINRFEHSDYEGILSYHWFKPGFWMPLFLILWALNLYLDALIWRSVNGFLGVISLKRAFKTNFVSYALSFITPANSGEVAGRYIMLNQNQDRQKTLFLIFWSHFPRMIVKLGLGIPAILMLGVLSERLSLDLAMAVAFFTVAILLLVYFNLIKIQAWIYQRNIRRFNLAHYILNDRPRYKEKLKLLMLAFIKYLVYNIQFVALLCLWGNVDLSLELLSSVVIFYFITSIIPTFAAVDFIIKAAAAIYVFDGSLADESLLVNAAFMIWVFNVALPALGGLVVILKSNLGHSIKKKFSRGSLYGPSR